MNDATILKEYSCGPYTVGVYLVEYNSQQVIAKVFKKDREYENENYVYPILKKLNNKSIVVCEYELFPNFYGENVFTVDDIKYKCLLIEYLGNKDMIKNVFEASFNRNENIEIGINECVTIHTIPDILKFMHDISLGSSILHAYRLVHNDIKLENIVEHDGIYKFIDYSMTCSTSSQNNVIDCDTITTVGTRKYAPPEIDKKGVNYYSAEIYCIGIVFLLFVIGMYKPKGKHYYKSSMILLQLLTGSDSKNIKELLLNFVDANGEPIPYIVCKLINDMVHYVPERRPNMAYVYKQIKMLM